MEKRRKWKKMLWDFSAKLKIVYVAGIFPDDFIANLLPSVPEN